MSVDSKTHDTAQALVHQAVCIAREYRDGLISDAEMCRQLEAALRQLPAGEEWLPMDTAPRDGTRILVHFARDGVGVREAAWTEPEHADWKTWCVDDLKFGPYALRRWCDGDATGWQPLPPPPASGADNG